MAKQNAKSCIFCSGRGMSKEHVWSDWMGRYFPTRNEHNHNFLHIEDASWSDVVVGFPSAERRPGAMHQRKLRIVCEKCNNGWMSRVVDRAKPWVEPAILGHPVELDAGAQKAVATWATLTAVMAEYTDPDHMGVPQADREYLMANAEPPPTWTVTLAKSLPGSDYVHHYRHVGGPQQWLGKDGVLLATHHLQITTMLLRSLIIQTASFTWPGLATDYRAALRGMGLATIWPAGLESVTLPWGKSLGDADRFAFADGFIAVMTRELKARWGKTASYPSRDGP